MFLLIILFGLAALGLALALYLQADIPHRPLPPAQAKAAPAKPAPPASAVEVAPAETDTSSEAGGIRPETPPSSDGDARAP